jgi:hypothetical protein
VDLTTIRTKKRQIVTITRETNEARDVEHHVVDCSPVSFVRFGATGQEKDDQRHAAGILGHRVYSWADIG